MSCKKLTLEGRPFDVFLLTAELQCQARSDRCVKGTNTIWNICFDLLLSSTIWNLNIFMLLRKYKTVVIQYNTVLFIINYRFIGLKSNILTLTVPIPLPTEVRSHSNFMTEIFLRKSWTNNNTVIIPSICIILSWNIGFNSNTVEFYNCATSFFYKFGPECHFMSLISFLLSGSTGMYWADRDLFRFLWYGEYCYF